MHNKKSSVLYRISESVAFLVTVLQKNNTYIRNFIAQTDDLLFIKLRRVTGFLFSADRTFNNSFTTSCSYDIIINNTEPRFGSRIILTALFLHCK